MSNLLDCEIINKQFIGKQPEDQWSNKPSDVIMRMAKPVLGTGRNSVAGNWFTHRTHQ